MRGMEDYRKLRVTRSQTRAAIILQKYARRMIVPSMSIDPYIDVGLAARWRDDGLGLPANKVEHVAGWNEKNHYGEMGWCWCGQSCPCCRAKAGDILGACEICMKLRS
jgi:hypothetical protein